MREMCAILTSTLNDFRWCLLSLTILDVRIAAIEMEMRGRAQRERARFPIFACALLSLATPTTRLLCASSPVAYLCRLMPHSGA